jgi:hypothetical protein
MSLLSNDKRKTWGASELEGGFQGDLIPLSILCRAWHIVETQQQDLQKHECWCLESKRCTILLLLLLLLEGHLLPSRYLATIC